MTKPKIEPTPPPDAIAVLREELADYEKQRLEAQQQAAFWQRKADVSDGAYQATLSSLKRLEPSPKSQAVPEAEVAVAAGTSPSAATKGSNPDEKSSSALAS